MPSMTLSCFICNMPMQGGRTSAPQGKAAHQACRRGTFLGVTHGKPGYRRGCRCDDCKAGQAKDTAEYVAKFRAKNGIHPSTAWRAAYRAANGYWPNARGSDWIHPRLRLEIYVRDGWACYLCGSAVDRDGDPNGDRAPSLDHVIPRSKGGTHDPSNLKTACRSCNSRKGVQV